MDSIANQKLKLAFWIIENLNKENMLVMTQRKIAEKTGISLRTVSKTMKLLCEPEEEGTPPFLQKINSGAYRVNPNVLFKGSYKNRMGICYEFISTEIENRED
jgi:transcriptional regulator with XRE-family HTH domain